MSKGKPPPKKCVKTCCTSSDSWVFIMKRFNLENENNSLKSNIVKLRHPQTKSGCLFLLSSDNSTIQEIQTFNDPLRSFFINETIKSDGKIFLSTPVDPLFLVLPYLKEAGRCSPLDQLLVDEEFPQVERLLHHPGLKHLTSIADQRGGEELNAFIYNEEKTLRWLEKKILRVADAVRSKGYHVSSRNAISATFVVSSKKEESQDEYLRYALGIVAEYISQDLNVAVEKHLKLPVEMAEMEKKRKTSPLANGRVDKKQKTANCDDSPDLPISPPLSIKNEKEKKVTPSAKEKARAKAASNTKSIASFFKKK